MKISIHFATGMFVAGCMGLILATLLSVISLIMTGTLAPEIMEVTLPCFKFAAAYIIIGLFLASKSK